MEWNIIGVIFTTVNIFSLEKVIIRIMIGVKPTILRRSLFKRYIFDLFHGNVHFY
jgi:hypothetical protein